MQDAEIVSHRDLAAITFADDDLLFFTDDDDWTDPRLFRSLRAAGPVRDGLLWRSIFVGKLFTDTPHEKRLGAIVQERPASDVVYTNNYAATGAAWKRLGPERLLEHYSAQAELTSGAFEPVRIDDYLTAANKHICCTVCIDYNSRSVGFLRNLRAAVSQIIDELDAVQLSNQTSWITKILQNFASINREALQ